MALEPCPCLSTPLPTIDILSLSGLADVREHCAALKQLLAPDEVWELIVAHNTGPLDDALHCSFLAKAYHRGTLGKVTGPIHQFLLTGQDTDARLTKQYRRDLRERWLAETDERSRHQAFRRFLGKIVELQVARWLTERQWTVTGLEALGERVDIIASSPKGVSHAIDVKYIGQADDDFELVLDSLRGGGGVGCLSLYGAMNYLLFRVYEASVALRRHSLPAVAVIVVDEQAWVSIGVPLNERWIDWREPAFLRTEERDWNDFLDRQRAERYPNIDSELAAAILGLSRIVVLRVDGEFTYSVALDHAHAG